MITNQQQNKYLETAVRTASPAQLLIMLCDGAARFCKLGIESLKRDEKKEAFQFFYKVQNILNEFIVTLDRNSPIADDLIELYSFYINELNEINRVFDIKRAEEVLAFLLELKETWVQAALLATKNGTREKIHG